MLKKYSRFFKTVFLLSDVSIIAFCWVLTYFHWFNGREIAGVEKAPLFEEHLILLFPVVGVYSIVFTFLRLYEPKRTADLFDELIGIFKASLASMVVLSFVFLLIKEPRYAGLLSVFFGMIVVLAVSLSRVCLRKGLGVLRSKGYNLRHILIVGTGSLAREVADKIREHQEFGLEIVGHLSKEEADVDSTTDGIKVVGKYEDVRRFAEENLVDQIFFALPQQEHDELRTLLGCIADSMVNVFIFPDLRYEFFTLRSGVEDFDGLPIVGLREGPLYGWNRIVKQCLDYVSASVALLLCSPLMALIAILIKAGSRGPVFYTQERIGYDGRVFKIIKFRSMREGAEAETGAVWAKEDDPRRTRIGRIIRKASMDELPQLFNVLKGEMSLVGPRPERPVFIDKFRKEVPLYMLKHKVKAGLTGWAQIHGLRGNTSLEKRIEYDLYYIENWSVWLDIRILFLTIPALFKREGVY